MLRSLNTLLGYTVSATDGDIGTVRNFYFDDQAFTVRYLVVNTSGFGQGPGGPEEVLISPAAFRKVDWTTTRFHLALTQERVRGSPPIALDKPVSRQYEELYYRYYDWPYYWGDSRSWTTGEYTKDAANAPGAPQPAGDPHLRSLREVVGYHIQGSNDQIGHVEDFIIDDDTWTIRYLVVDTRNWWHGRSVLIAPHWIGRVSWPEKKVHVNLRRETIKNSPEWDPEKPVNRAYEARLYDYYGRPAYWAADAAPPVSPLK